MANRTTRTLFYLILSIFFGSLTAAQADAATIHVATNGGDNNPGTISLPVATVRRAVELASSGDTIYLRSGRYTVTRYLWIDKAGLTISSFPGESATVYGSNTDSNVGFILGVFADNISLLNLTVEGGETYCLKIEEAANVVVRGCRLFNSGRDCVKTFNADNLLIENCDIGPSGVRDSSNAEGIDSIGSIGVTIRGNYIHDTATCGLYLKGGAMNGVVERNRVERTGSAGILLGQDTDLEFMRDGTPYEARNCVARNNVIASTHGAGIGTYSGSNVRFENNTLYDVAKSYHAGFYVVTNTREVQPRQVKFKNNVVVGLSSRPMVFIINIEDQLASDSNIFYRPSGGVYKFFYETPTRAFYWESFGDWQGGMSVDGRSATIDPLLDSSQLWRLRSGSPAIDRGEALSGVTNDYSGGARPQGNGFDLGAHESGSSGAPPPPPPPSPQPPSNRPPTVTISASATSGIAPLRVDFSANAVDPDGNVASYRWDFGDGERADQGSVSHVFRSAGNFTARLTVTDNAGATASADVVIRVSESAPPEPVEPKVNLFTPNGRETLTGGSTYTIAWAVSGTGLRRQDISVSFDGGSTWEDVVLVLPGTTTSYEWRVPNRKSRTVKIRVVSYGNHRYTGQDESDRNFTIVKVTKSRK